MEDEDEDDDDTMPRKRRNIEFLESLELPPTCTVLKTRRNAFVYLIGTAHFSRESQDDVSKVIQSVQPNAVVLELCKSRTNILHMDEETILSEAQNLNFDRMVRVTSDFEFLSQVMKLFCRCKR